MEMITFIAALCIGLSVLLTPCYSHQIQQAQLSVHALPRKLKVLTQDLIVNEQHGGKDSTSSHKPNVADFTGKSSTKEANMMHVKGGTWKEWIEGSADTSDFFTMDYSHVRRRRPIHNKALPVAP